MSVAALTKELERAKGFHVEKVANAAALRTPQAGDIAIGATADGAIILKNSAGVSVTVGEESGTTQTVNPAADSGVGSVILPASNKVVVGPVVNDADDWIVLPAVAGVSIGHQIVIACNAGTNFELRTPAASGTKVNDVDADGTQEYLCTDTDLITVTKHTTTGWVAVSETKLGARRAAVVPD